MPLRRGFARTIGSGAVTPSSGVTAGQGPAPTRALARQDRAMPFVGVLIVSSGLPVGHVQFVSARAIDRREVPPFCEAAVTVTRLPGAWALTSHSTFFVTGDHCWPQFE